MRKRNLKALSASGGSSVLIAIGVFLLTLSASTGFAVQKVKDPKLSDKTLPEAQNPSTQTTPTGSPKRSRLFVHMLYGVAVNQLDDQGILLKKPDHIGNVIIGFAENATWEIDVSYYVTTTTVFRLGYQLANLDFGDMFRDTQIATARYSMPKLGIFYYSPFTNRKLTGGLGLLVGWPHYRFRVSTQEPKTVSTSFGTLGPGLDPRRIREISSTGGFQIGYAIEFQAVEISGVFLGFSFSQMISNGEITIETESFSNFESGFAHFVPMVLGVTLGYRFP